MAEELTPPKEAINENDGENSFRTESKWAGDAPKREDTLRELAKACKRQGNFHLACKKYTQVSLR